jgi:hypothetical protein
MDPRLRRLQQEITSVVSATSTEQLTWHSAGKWCAAEVLEHLYLTYTGTIKGFERMAGAGGPRTKTASWVQRGRKLVVLGLSYLPSGREAPPFARPRGLPSEKVLAEIVPKIAEMDDMIGRCERRFGSRTKLLDHPILGPLTAGQWRKFHFVHGLHHLEQIRRLRGEMGKQNKIN